MLTVSQKRNYQSGFHVSSQKRFNKHDNVGQTKGDTDSLIENLITKERELLVSVTIVALALDILVLLTALDQGVTIFFCFNPKKDDH